MKEARVFSWPLFKQTVRSNMVLCVVILAIMCLMASVFTVAGNMLDATVDSDEYTEEQETFYAHLMVLAAYDQATGANLSYEDFAATSDRTMYDTLFDQAMALSDEDSDIALSSEAFEQSADALSQSEISLDDYIAQFEYVYALASEQGVFSGDDLNMEEMLSLMLNMMGVSTDLVESVSEMDTGSLLNQMYFTITGLLPILILIVVVGNSLIAERVDRGSMAYILSTPTRRSAVAITQAIYMLVMPLIIIAIVCGVRCAVTYAVTGSLVPEKFLALYGGMYVLVEAMCGICYFGSCHFNLSKYSMSFGGGLCMWFFLATLLGLFGSENLVNLGIGVESLGIFNNLSIIGLYDIDALGTVGSGAVDYGFVPGLIVLAVIALVFYVAGALRFQKKDLPL